MRGVIQVGDTVGPFTIVAKLGRGGMSTVYNAYEAGLDREVALKVLPIDLLEEPGFADRFEREARLIAKLEHPHIVPLYAYGIDDGVPWMALRLVRGGHLGERLENGSINHDAGLAYFTMIADALDHAHSLGVVHRDLKPQNVLLGEHGELYLADFGISRLLQGRTTITSTGAVLGTPQYMSPEQAQDSQVGPSADIYALGIMAYQWLTGLLPFDADTPYAVMYKHVNSPLAMEPLDGLPERARQVLARALAKQSDQRWPTAGKFIDELAGALGVEGVPGQVLSSGRLPASVAAAISARKLTKVPPAPTEHLPAGRTDTPRPLPTPQSRPVTPATVVRPPGGFEEARTVPPAAAPPPPSPPVSPTDPKALQFRPRGAPPPKARTDPRLLGVGAGGALVLALVAWWIFGGSGDEAAADPAAAVAGAEATAADPAATEPAAAAEPPPLPAGDARLLLEADLPCDLVINGYPRGQLQAMTPLRLELAPGRYTLSCTATEHPDVEAKQVASVVRDEPTVALFELKLQIEQREATRQAEERRRIEQEKADALARQQKEDAEAAEARRLVEEAKRREEDRVALEERKLQEARQAAERRRREESLKLDEARRAAAARRAGTTAPPPAAAAAPDPQAQARQAEARRIAEARRQAEAKRKADEEAARLAAEQAAAATAAAAAPAAPPRRLTPIPVSTPQPFYPPDALRGGVKGAVQVEITIGRDGAVKDLRILQAKPRGVFERSVQATVRNWRFQPLDEDVTIRKTIVFR